MKAKQAAPKPTLNPHVKTAIWRTWSYIESDAYELGVNSNRDALELVLDAGRIQQFGIRKEDGPEVKQALDEFMKLDWKVMMKLANTVKLV